MTISTTPPIQHQRGCPAAECSEGYYSRNQGGINFTRVECITHNCRTRAFGGYDPYRCTIHNPNKCTCRKPS